MTKRRIILIASIILLLAVEVLLDMYSSSNTAVEAKTSNSAELEELDSMYEDDFFYWVDPETGVNYIVFYGMDGRCTMTPRLSSTGKIIVTHD